eukprot:GILI01020433.1.p1 GENE.GILI01020433.1~~GILI01020433.1.p1  ORF type:complete len:278 (+),score=64.05 GILI01020433.1:37-834(+)
MYTRAVCRLPATSFVNALRREEPDTPISVSALQQEHEKYIEELKSLGLEVSCIPADDNHPDCVFIEDTCVVNGQTCLVSHPGHPSRVGETRAVKDFFAAIPGFRVEELASLAPEARMDGGDVMFTGSEYFIGMSARTNEQAAVALGQVFQVPVLSLPVSGSLHLKSLMSMCGQNQIAMSDTEEGRELSQQIERERPGKYQFVWIPAAEGIAANCLYINGTLVHQSAEDFPLAAAIYAGLGTKTLPMVAREIRKADGALTCCSVLF